MSKVLVLGAGASGLACSYYLEKKGVSYTTVEASAKVGGNAQTFWEGKLGYDSGAHRLHDVYDEITKEYHTILKEDITQIHSPSVIFSKGKFFDFPLSPLDIFKNLMFTELLEAIRTYVFKKRENGDFEKLAIARYGQFIANKFLLGYTQKLWGVECYKLSEQVAGKRLKGLDIETFLKELFTTKSVKTTHLDGSFFYPKYGIGQLFDVMSESLNIQLNTAVESIKVEQNRIVEVVAGGKKEIPEKVVSSLPMPLLLKMMDIEVPQKVHNALQTLQFVDLYLVSVFLNRSSITKNASLYFPDSEVVFTRVVEPKNRSSFLAPEDQTMLVAEVPVLNGEVLDEETLKEKVKKQLLVTELFLEKDVTKLTIKKIKYAYPVLTKAYEENLSEIKDILSSIDNLYLTGRVANFTYQHIHDHFKEGKEIAEEIADEK